MFGVWGVLLKIAVSFFTLRKKEEMKRKISYFAKRKREIRGGFQCMCTKCILFLRHQGEGGEVKEQTARMKVGTGASNYLIPNSGKRLQPCARIKLMCRGRWERWHRKFRL